MEEADTSNQENITLDPNNFHAKRISNSAITLITIVLVYVILNTPRLILNLAEYFLFHDIHCPCDQTPVWVSVLARISHLFLAINSSINFLIYYSIGRKFKNTLSRFRSRRPPKSNAEFSLPCTEQKEMIPLQILSRISFRTQRSVSLNSLDKKGSRRRYNMDLTRQRSYSITLE